MRRDTRADNSARNVSGAYWNRLAQGEELVYGDLDSSSGDIAGDELMLGEIALDGDVLALGEISRAPEGSLVPGADAIGFPTEFAALCPMLDRKVEDEVRNVPLFLPQLRGVLDVA